MIPIAAALPWIASAVGSMLPVIIDSFSKGRTPDEAAAFVAPKRAMLLKRMTDAGMPTAQAGPIVDSLIQGEIEKAQIPEHMSPFVSATLGAMGAIGGFKGGSMLAARMSAPAAAATTAAAASIPAAAAVAPAAEAAIPVREATYASGFRSPQAERGFAGAFDAVSPVRSGGNVGHIAPEQVPRLGYEEPMPRLGYEEKPIQMGYKPPQEPISMGYKMDMMPSSEDQMLMDQLAEILKRRQMGAAQALRRNQFNWQGESPARSRMVGQPVTGDIDF